MVFLKDRVITIFFSDKEMSLIISEIKEFFKRHTIPIRPNRKIERDMEKYRKRKKPKVFKNKRDAI